MQLPASEPVIELLKSAVEPERDGTAVLSFVGKGSKARTLIIPPKVFSAVQRHARKRRLSWSRASDLDDNCSTWPVRP